MPKKKQHPTKSSKPRRSTSGSTKPQGGVGRGILESAIGTPRASKLISGWGWDKEFQRLVKFRKGHPGNWPLRDSTDPKEVWLANWFRGNLELFWARRLNAARTNMILNLIEGRYDLPVKAGKPSGSKAGKRKIKRA